MVELGLNHLFDFEAGSSLRIASGCLLSLSFWSLIMEQVWLGKQMASQKTVQRWEAGQILPRTFLGISILWSSVALRLGLAILVCGWLIFKSQLIHGHQSHPYPSFQQIPEKHLLLLYWLHQSLWLCRSQQTMENSSWYGNTRPPDLPPEKSVCRSSSNS